MLGERDGSIFARRPLSERLKLRINPDAAWDTVKVNILWQGRCILMGHDIQNMKSAHSPWYARYHGLSWTVSSFSQQQD